MSLEEQDITFKRYLKDIERYPRISHQKEKKLSKIINGDLPIEEKEKAEKELIEANLKLVVKCALDFYNKIAIYKFISLMDLIAEGNVSLIKSAKKFNAKESKFSTYAYIGIRRDIQKFISLSTFIHIPLNHFKYWTKMREIEEKHGFKLTNKEMAKELGLNSSIVEWIRAGQNSAMIKMMDEEEDYHDKFLVDEHNVVDKIEGNDLKKFLVEKMNQLLPPRDKDILYDRFFVHEDCTLEFLASKYKISRERVRQICARAFKRLRNGLQKEWEERAEKAKKREKKTDKKQSEIITEHDDIYYNYINYDYLNSWKLENNSKFLKAIEQEKQEKDRSLFNHIAGLK